MSVRIPLADSAVAAVNQKFCSLIPGNLPRSVNRLLLGVVHRGGVAAAGRLDRPPVRVRHDVLVVFCYDYFSLSRS